jgi:outer membrane receptor for ferrienterochelin and colicin
MLKKYLFLCGLIFILPVANAQIKGVVTDNKGEPIPGANVFWLNTNMGTVTDNAGNFQLHDHSGATRIVVSNVAYNPDTIVVDDKSLFIRVKLRDQLLLREVTVVSKVPGTVKGRTAVFQTEKITSAEFTKAACCNLSESFETNPSVDVSYSDAATGAKQIKLLGLSGTYVQMLNENVPTLRGVSSVYGLGFIPGPWMESIQVSKGTSSVVNGYEAIAGQINVEYKKPQLSEIVAVNLFASDAGRVEANATATAKLNDYLSTGVFLHASDEFTELDQNKDGFMDMPMVKQYNVANRWLYKKDKYISQAYIRALSEVRTGGQMDHHAYKIGIDTKRYEFFLKNGYVFNSEKGESAGLILSGSLHNQKANYGTKTYSGEQGNFYANFIYQTNIGRYHKLSAGASFNVDDYSELLNTTGTEQVFPRREYVPGAFAEYTLNLNDKFILLGGLRADYNSLYGAFITPRLHLKYNISEHLHLRASAGKGYRSPNVLAENNNLLASNRTIIIDNGLNMEEAWNYGLSLQGYFKLFGRPLSITGEWYYTDFKRQVVADMDSDPHAVHFSNLMGKSFSESAQIEANLEVVRGLTVTMAHRVNDVQTTIGGLLREKPLTSRSKSMITASYQTPLKKWQFDFTAQFNGSGRLPDSDESNPLWNNEFDSYSLLNAQVTKYFRKWSVYIGAENLTDFIQKNSIIDVQNPFSNNFDASMVWGPTHGRKFYIGFRWAIDRL